MGLAKLIYSHSIILSDRKGTYRDWARFSPLEEVTFLRAG
jgi:hypothetical protein